MDGNPYARMVAVIRGETSEKTPTGETDHAGLGASPCKMRLGKVIQQVPLKLKVAGIEQPTEVLKINERLVKGAKWKVKITSEDSDYKALTGNLEGPVTCGGEGCAARLGAVTGGQLHSDDTRIGSEEKKAVTEQLEIDLEVGDQVLLLTEDDQIFYILMKVVDAV
jgi:hypothetical protein